MKIANIFKKLLILKTGRQFIYIYAVPYNQTLKEVRCPMGLKKPKKITNLKKKKLVLSKNAKIRDVQLLKTVPLPLQAIQ